MKCPKCNSKIDKSKISTNEDTMSPIYTCSDCDVKLGRKYGFTFFIIFLIIGAPIVGFVVGLLWGVFNDLVLSVYIELDKEVFNVIEMILSGLAWVFLYFKINKIEQK